MADLSDVSNVLVSSIAQIAYPNGTGSPSIVATACKIYSGWPIPANLDKDLAAGAINISVYPNDNEQKTTRYPKEWKALPVTIPALTLTVVGTTITVGGTPTSPLNAAALVNGAGYVYAVQSGDSLTSIATGLAALISGATSSGPVITIPGAYQLTARVGAVGTVIRETKRQKRSFQITFWCPNPTVRDQIAAPVDAALADIDFLTLPDGTAGRIIYERSRVSDRVEREGLYRRDLFYSVEYGTTDSLTTAQIVAEIFNITGGIDPSAPAITSFTI
jgi:hypothetical protein